MITNFHTHTTFCDGKNTAEEMVLSAIDKGFDSLGFSGHADTAFDHTYCMTDTEGYIKEINRLKAKYQDKIQIYLGIEQDAFYPVERERFDYIIGSSHYFLIDGKYYPIDSNFGTFSTCIEKFEGNYMALAESYYKSFCEYILREKPDIIGHFDLVTKFDELNPLYLENAEYKAMAKKYLLKALSSGSFFEVNTGAISRGYRHSPYPSADLLHTLKNNGGKLVITSDSHAADTLDCYFKETRQLLKEIGFQYVYTIYNGEFIKDYL